GHEHAGPLAQLGVAEPAAQGAGRQLARHPSHGGGEAAPVAAEEVALGTGTQREEVERARRLDAEPPPRRGEDLDQEREHPLAARLTEVADEEEPARLV